jgi:hypothetical protein
VFENFYRNRSFKRIIIIVLKRKFDFNGRTEIENVKIERQKNEGITAVSILSLWNCRLHNEMNPSVPDGRRLIFPAIQRKTTVSRRVQTPDIK